jgi:hypothetical protein
MSVHAQHDGHGIGEDFGYIIDPVNDLHLQASRKIDHSCISFLCPFLLQPAR